MGVHMWRAKVQHLLDAAVNAHEGGSDEAAILALRAAEQEVASFRKVLER